MKTVPMTIDDDLIREVDAVAEKRGTTRPAFTRKALRSYLDYLNTQELEKRQIEGYKQYPPKGGEFDVWENEQTWTD